MNQIKITRGNRNGLAWEIAAGEWFYSAWIDCGRLLAHCDSVAVSFEDAINRIEDAIARSW
jgi:hypothetical protein